jgi:predicted RecB family nuclease
MTVSKSRFQSGLSCLRKAYLEVHAPQLAKPPSIADQQRMMTGQEVGRLARRLYEDGVLIEVPSYDMERAAQQTASAIHDGARVLFEAAFVTDDAEVRVDVLERLDDGTWHLIEVKSSKSPKPEHVTDVAFQRCVLERCGLAVSRASLLLVSEGFRRNEGPIDPRTLFALADVTQETQEAMSDVDPRHREILDALALPQPPDVVLNVHCRRDGECPFLAHCWQGMPLHDVTTLPRIKAEVVHDLHALGIRDLAAVPADFKLSERQRLIAAVVRTGVPFVSEGLASVLEGIHHPVHFIDFEASMSAIPEYEGTAPYRSVPFQWSNHILDCGAVSHAEFLHRGRDDPRPEFVRTLWEAVKDAGSICYYSSYEKSRLAELAHDGLPFASETLEAITERGIDLEKVVAEHVYLPEFLGKTSIKRVYPALVPTGGYQGLAISDGDTAAAEFRRMLSPATTPQQADLIAADLLRYCERDTQAMLDVFLAMMELSRSPSSPYN